MFGTFEAYGKITTKLLLLQHSHQYMYLCVLLTMAKLREQTQHDNIIMWHV